MNLSYLFAAYAVFWGLTFLFVLNLTSRLRRLEREIEALKQALERETLGTTDPSACVTQARRRSVLRP
jgi:CcmD family protein